MNEVKYEVYGKQLRESEWQWITEIDYSFKAAADLCDEMVQENSWYNAGVKQGDKWIYTTGENDE